MEHSEETLIIIDFGSQYTQLIARKARELGVFSLILPFNATITDVQRHNCKGIVLSGGPNSAGNKDSPRLDVRILHSGIPILGICYGLQLMTAQLGGKIESSSSREYGSAKLDVKTKSDLLPMGCKGTGVWMSHGDHVVKPPRGFKVSATSNGISSVIENQKIKMYGLQFHPEVTHTTKGILILKRFIEDICGFSQNWSAREFIREQEAAIKKQVGSERVVCALSGGVDSSVAATLVNSAVGEQQLCVFVDTGLLREDEFDEVLSTYKKIGLNVKPIRAKDKFLSELKGVADPERKRKIIGREFINIFEAEAKKFSASFLVQGTLYPDVIESVSVNGPSVTIKSHHNVGGLPQAMKLKLVEPLRELFKDEVRLVGAKLGLPKYITQRQPFPGPGLAIRILSQVDNKSLKLLRHADKIVRQEIETSTAKNEVWQYFAALLPIKSVGVMGDNRTYEQVVAVRCVSSVDGMTAQWAKLPHETLERISNRIVNEIHGVNRVVYDITSKPPGTIEWE